MNGDGSLVVLIGGESLTLLGWDEWRSGDDNTHDSTDGFDTEGEGSGVDNNDIIAFFTANNTSLDGGTISDSFIGIDTSVGFFSIEEIFNELSDFGNTGGTSDKNDFANIGLFESGFFEGVLDGTEGLFEEISVEFFKSGSGEYFVEVKTFN